ncbi:hypothetical protein BH10ACT1_BH10ACT1_22730 [soil metagenome]
MRLDRIVVGIDGSANSDRAADVAATLADLSGARVLAVHSTGLLEAMPSEGTTAAERRSELRHHLEHEWTDVLRHPDIDVRCELREAAPVDGLLAAISEFDADLVIVGCRGVGVVPTQLLGSTSAQLAIVTPCPILIVPDRLARTT